MKTYNREILRHDENSKYNIYICSLCELDTDLSLNEEDQYNVKKRSF